MRLDKHGRPVIKWVNVAYRQASTNSCENNKLGMKIVAIKSSEL